MSLTAEREEAPLSAAPAHRDGSVSSLTSAALAQMVVINLLWGGSSVAAKAGLSGIGPCTLALVRFLPAGLLLLGLFRIRRAFPRIEKRDALWFFLLSFVGITLTYAVFYVGVEQTTAADASLLNACEPILIALAARIFLGEILTGQQWLGMLVGLAGIWLIAGQALGNQIALLGLVLELSVSVVAKRLTMRYPGLYVVGLEMVIGSALLIPLAANELRHGLPHVTAEALGGVLYLSLICSALCYGVWFRLMERYNVSTLAIFILVQPTLGPFYGWLFLGDHLKPGSLLGGLLVILGIALTTLRLRKMRNTDTSH